MKAHTPYMCRGHQLSWNWNNRQLGATTQVLATELISSVRQQVLLTAELISPALEYERNQESSNSAGKSWNSQYGL